MSVASLTEQHVATSNGDKFFEDIYAVFRKWDFLLLRIQVLLIWERIVPSLIFSAAVHLLFWLVVLSKQSFLFVSCFALLLVVLFDFFRNWLLLFVEDPQCTPGSFTEFVNCALQNGYILSTKDLSHWVAAAIYRGMSILNRLAPLHRSRRFASFLINSSLSVACIFLGRCFSGQLICYALLNVALLYPILRHHDVITRFWIIIKPILTRMEAEFDRHSLEEQSEREADEAKFYEPIIAAAMAENRADDAIINVDYPTGEYLNPESQAGFSQTGLSGLPEISGLQDWNASDDLSTSESAFVRKFVPKMSNQEIDRLFADALAGDLGAKTSQPVTHERPPSTNSSRSSSVDPVHNRMMLDEYATDDDEPSIEEISDVNEDLQHGKSSGTDDFVFLVPTTTQ